MTTQAAAILYFGVGLAFLLVNSVSRTTQRALAKEGKEPLFWLGAVVGSLLGMFLWPLVILGGFIALARGQRR